MVGYGMFDCNNRPLIYKYSGMAPRLSGQTSIFGVVFFISKSHLGIERQKKLKKFTILTQKSWSHVRIWIYRTWANKKEKQATFKRILVFPAASRPNIKILISLLPKIFDNNFPMLNNACKC